MKMQISGRSHTYVSTFFTTVLLLFLTHPSLGSIVPFIQTPLIQPRDTVKGFRFNQIVYNNLVCVP